MSMLMLKLLACMVARAHAGKFAACSGEAAATDASCAGDATQASSFIQTASQPSRQGRNRQDGATHAAAITSATADSSVTIPKGFCKPKDGPHMRVRKNIFDMDVSQWQKFKKAFRSLYEQGLYKKYAVEHTKHYDDDPDNGLFKDHGGAYGFLAFHRGQIQDLETELMQEADDCSIGFPFWDWSLDVETFKTSEIWSDKYMGDDQGCVKSGLPGGWEYEAEGAANPCVERKVKKTRGIYDSLRIAKLIKGVPEFEDFVQDLEGVHNAVHGAIKGNMANKVGKASPSDPMFYLHHAFIDSIYFRWQQSHEDTSADLLRDELVPVIGQYSKGLDCVYLPIHRSIPQQKWATCVHYKTTDNVHPPGSSLLQAFTADGKCEAL
jgi:tyrosinase